MRRRSALIALLALAATAPPAAAATETAGSGPVSATLSYDHTEDSPEWGALSLTIARDGATVLTTDPSYGDCEQPYCAPGGFGDRDSVIVDDLDGDGEPEVIVDLYTGGAHCCYVSRFYRWDGATYVPADRNFGDPGYRIQDLDGDGVKELVTADYRFGYAFTAFAFSLMPLRIYDLRAGSWQLVTTHYPDRVRADAKRNWGYFRKAGRQGEPRGAIAAWTADQLMLGHRAKARRTLLRLARQGRLHGSFPKSPRKFVHNLLAFLAKRGY
jgi:hypothetical protein